MFFRELLFAACLLAAAPMTAQVIEDISMLTAPGSSEAETPSKVLPLLTALDPASLVLVKWKDGTDTTIPAGTVLAWYDAPPKGD